MSENWIDGFGCRCIYHIESNKWTRLCLAMAHRVGRWRDMSEEGFKNMTRQDSKRPSTLYLPLEVKS